MVAIMACYNIYSNDVSVGQ